MLKLVFTYMKVVISSPVDMLVSLRVDDGSCETSVVQRAEQFAYIVLPQLIHHDIIRTSKSINICRDI